MTDVEYILSRYPTSGMQEIHIDQSETNKVGDVQRKVAEPHDQFSQTQLELLQNDSTFDSFNLWLTINLSYGNSGSLSVVFDVIN